MDRSDALRSKYDIDLTSPRATRIIREMFGIKRVPLSYLGRISEMRALHAAEYATVQEALRPGTALEPFDYYFDRVVALCASLEPLWHE